MKKMSKRAAVAALAGVMAMGLLTGCGEKKLDGTKTVATVNGTEIPMGVLSIMVRQSQAQTEAMYASFMGGSDFAIWETEAEEGKTFGQQAVEQSLEELETMYIMKEKAADYGVEVTEEDQKAIAEAAAEFIKANSQETIEKLAVTEEQVKTYLELRTYEARMHDPIVADVDTEVSEDESQQSSFSYVSISTADLEEKEIKKKKEEAQEILDNMKKDPKADFEEVVKAVNEEYTALDGTFDTTAPKDEEDASSSYPAKVLEVLRSLKDGEMGPDVIETDTGYYVVRLDKINDEEATADKKDSIIEERKSELYTDTTASWREEAEITVDKKVLKTLTITDNNKFVISVPETEEGAEDTLEETPAEETSEDASSEELPEDEVLVPAEEEAEAAGEETAE
ncbi:MAG: peptidyl-prolyl cis-trans isomerase [Blautia sp.]|uniref:peptidyl-prolyl cis-trans isomerase n=1 Tax=Blautia sp. TaxID=1955243 RepID=UPI003992CD13